MDYWLIIAVLFAALLHASWNALVKIGGDGILTFFLFKVGCLPFAVLLLVFTGLPDAASLPYLLASGSTLLAYALFLAHAYKRADFSLVYPIARGTAPVIVAVLAMVFAAEPLSGLALGGTVVVSAGIMFLAYGSRPRDGVLAGLASAFGVGVTIAVYTVLDGIGARLSGDAIAYMAALNIISFVPIAVYVMIRRPAEAAALVAREWRRGILGGTIMYLAYGIVIYALTLAPMAAISSLRETSVIIAAIIGTRLLGEPFGMRRVIAAGVVAAGVVLIILSRT